MAYLLLFIAYLATSFEELDLSLLLFVAYLDLTAGLQEFGLSLLPFIAYLDLAAGLQELGLSLQQGVDALLGFLELLFWRFFGGNVSSEDTLPNSIKMKFQKQFIPNESNFNYHTA